MEPTIFKFILKYSKREQILLLVLTALTLPFTYLTLEVPKLIINKALSGKGVPEEVLGFGMDQISYLFVLCGIYLTLTVINGGIKYFLNVYRGIVGEKMLLRLRHEMYSRVLRFPIPVFKRLSPGEIIPMIVAETQEIGGFIGDAISLPAFQGGMLATYLLFIFNQDPFLGLFAITFYPLQLYITPKIQRRISARLKERIITVRSLSQRIEETVSGATEVHAHDTSHYEQADISHRLGKVFWIRADIFKKKFLIKFINNFINKLTPVLFYSIGGYFVIQGELSLGALVAVLAAYSDLSGPWRELLKYYQTTADTQVKYQQIIDQFHPDGMLPRELQEREPEPERLPPAGHVTGANIVYSEGGSSNLVDGANFEFNLGRHIALSGTASSGKRELSALIARILWPDGGVIEAAGLRLDELAESFTGRRFAYVDANAYIFRGSIRDNLYYGLKHQPLWPRQYEGEALKEFRKTMRLAEQTGSSRQDIHADWIDYRAAGVEDAAGLEAEAQRILRLVELEDDIFQAGLGSCLDPEQRPELAKSLLQARERFYQDGEERRVLVERFNQDRYNTNASVGENLFFGTFQKDALATDEAAGRRYVLKILQQSELYEPLREIGRQVAETMVELFADLPPQHEFHSRFSFISPQELPDYQHLLEKIKREGMDGLSEEENIKLLTLAFQLTPARHRLGFIDEAMQEKLLRARKLFRENLPLDLFGKTEFFSADRYIRGITVRENILLGKMVYGTAGCHDKCERKLVETIDELGLRGEIVALGLDYDVGNAGTHLSVEQRQKLALGRCLIKHPDLMVVNEATGVMGAVLERRLMENIRGEMAGRTLLWVVGRSEMAEQFDEVLKLENGTVIGQRTQASLPGKGQAKAGEETAGEEPNP